MSLFLSPLGALALERALSKLSKCCLLISKTVINAGTTSPYFSPSIGIREGCCVLHYFFILVAELLASMVRNNNQIKGLE